jgi:hypothetical protein
MDLTGKQFGDWTVEGLADERRTHWLCRCVCGNMQIVGGINLREGLSINCKACTKKRWADRYAVPLIGKSFGDWTVINLGSKPVGPRSTLLCQCRCGKQREVDRSSLLSGYSKGCGCDYTDYSGQTFGFVTIIERDGYKDGDVAYRCRCVCGNECILRRGYFIRNASASCGCQAINGFDQKKPASLYYLRVINSDGCVLYKVGVTNRSVKIRLGKNDRARCHVLLDARFADGSNAWKLEQIILKAFIKYAYKGQEVLDVGNTELFTKDILNLDAASNNPHVTEMHYDYSDTGQQLLNLA